MTQINALSVGPIVGHADTDHVRIWGRGELELTASGQPRRCFGVARFRKSEGSRYRTPLYFKMGPNFDMTGVAIFLDLEADTDYLFQMGWFFSDKELEELRSGANLDWHFANEGRFRTASADKQAARDIVFGSCRYLLRLLWGNWFDSRGDKTFRSILRQITGGAPIDKFMMIGDQIYADDLNFLAPDKRIDEYLNRYRDVFSQPYIRLLMSQVPTYMTLDDHEIEDNWPRHATNWDMMVKYPPAMHAYQIYQMSHSPLLDLGADGRLTGTPDHYFYQFRDGCCEFFVMDTRTERVPGSNVNDGEIIAEQQLLALFEWLNDRSGQVKLIVSSVPFFPDTRNPDGDKWNSFRQQRDDIISFIRTNRIEKVVFLSGDVHCSMAAELDISLPGDKPLNIYSVISSSFYWPYPHLKRRDFRLDGYVASTDNEQAYQLGQVSDVFGGDNFTRLRISPDGLQVAVYERKGWLRHEIRYQF